MSLLANPYAVANGVRERATPDPQVVADAIDARESVYRVIVIKNLGGGEVKVGTGTGFAIRARGNKCLILTCDHVLRGKKGGEDFDHTKDGLFVRKVCYTGDLKVRDFRARVLYTDELADLAVIEATGLTEVIPLRLDRSPFVLGRTAVAVGYCDVPNNGFTRTPTVSPGITTSYPHLSREGGWEREVVDLSCVSMPGNSGCPVVSSGGVLGVITTATTVVDIDNNTEHLVATQAIYTSTVLGVMKQWLHLPANDASTIDQVIGMFD